MRKIIFAIGLFLSLFACKTLDETIIEKIDVESQKNIDEIELKLLKMKFSNDMSYTNYMTDIDSTKRLIEKLEVKAKNNKYFKAKVLGLKGEVALLKREIAIVKDIITRIENITSSEEKLYILKADLNDNILEKEEIIKKGIENATSIEKLKLYLADIYFLQNKFEEAVALYDEVFVNLNDLYKSFYKKRRDSGYQFIKNPPNNPNIADILYKDKITVKDLLELTLSETDSIEKIVAENYKNSEELFNILNNKYNFFYKDMFVNIKFNDDIKRKDLAFFITNIISCYEKNNLINIYKPKEEINNPQKEVKDLSPIPDVKTYDYFYSSVLILVEREIMDLPDGERFYPDNYVKGDEYYKMLNRFAK